MATCSSILAWRIPWTEEPGRLQSMGHKESLALEGGFFNHWTGREVPEDPEDCEEGNYQNVHVLIGL